MKAKLIDCPHTHECDRYPNLDDCGRCDKNKVDLTCNDCDNYRPLSGKCKIKGSRDFLSNICKNFVAERDTNRFS